MSQVSLTWITKQITMQRRVFWIILIVLSSYNHCSVSFQIYIEGSAQRNCRPTTPKSSRNVNVTEYDNTNMVFYTCPDLDSALEYITTNMSHYDHSSYAHIFLPSGNFVLNNTWSMNISFVLTGHNEVDLSQSVIQCGYNDTQDINIVTNASDLEYTLFFKNVQFVKFEFVQFKNCPQPMRIEQSCNVSVLNSTFTNFSESVFDIYNSDFIKITGSNFSNNAGTGNVLLPFRGNTGAIAIGYFQNQYTNPTVFVENCMFADNKATISTESFLASPHSVLNGIYVGRGGALGLLVYESSYNVTAVITNSKFFNNFASDFGGGLYVVLSGESIQHKITVENCQFINNNGMFGAGGIHFGLFSNAHRNFPTTVKLQNCYYRGNQGGHGGAISIIPSQVEGQIVAIENSIFENNEASAFGGAIVIATQLLFESMEGFSKYNISNW